jgi:hypothetical protein
MIKGICITPTQIGRIAIGEVSENGGKRLPKKLDYITITGMSQTQSKWGEHPILKELRKGMANEEKLRSIPVRIMFDTVDNNLRAEYSCFDNKGRPICAGNGEKARRREVGGVVDVDCEGSDLCAFGKQNRCKLFGRLIIGIEGAYQQNTLAGFMFRTTSWNSVKQLKAALDYFHALSGGNIAGMPCNLKMRSKSTSASMRQPIFYLDLEPRNTLEEAVAESKSMHKAWADAGLDRPALEKAVSDGYNNSAFFEDDGDGKDIVEEFGFGSDAALDDLSEQPESSAASNTTSEVSSPVASSTKSETTSSEPTIPQEPKFQMAQAQEMEIVEWLEATGKTLEAFNVFLGRAPDALIFDMSEENYDKTLRAMGRTKKSSEHDETPVASTTATTSSKPNPTTSPTKSAVDIAKEAAARASAAALAALEF